MGGKWFAGVFAIAVLCCVDTASAQTRAPGSVDPPAASPPASQETITPAEGVKPAAKPAKRAHRRRAGRSCTRPFYLVPPPRYWFRPWPRCRSGWHVRHHHRHYRHRFFWRW
jgi:hypothetical protein